MQKITIAPSFLSANFADLKNEIKRCKEANIEWIHYDVMDYDFVPNLTFGSKILKDIVNSSDFKIDIHFMVKVKTKRFEDFFSEYIKCKPTMMTMHVESMSKKEINMFYNICKTNNIMFSLAVSPKTNIKVLNKWIDKLENILIMSVEPGFGGQSFIPEVLEKVKHLAELKKTNGYTYSIEIDGGINDETSKKAIDAGVEMMVAGSYLFESKNFSEKVESLKHD
ncbi:ribulose-phosphate 3-epimerase [Mesoplasma florum]|uniref:ribulose-phosphate 3-epimerase n=1 Tax=Mesoplasma florum TaxID=2151 RepID=UPI000BE2521F|nr:ribulose-phosphate 3-epimerase [Mesoplasma florum]ATI73865.1 ribulose-phosphate 3-epimerase [Mesoplasma florum]AVN58831.1 ribulose-phosphate 3-epimerase [Mesoplasma florum]AVN64964.1 ribulose-phosphate 3-epimerase [Mesoplasma florum]